MQAAQAMRAELPGCDLWSVLLEVDTTVAHFAFQRDGQIELGAPSIDERAHVHAPLGGPDQRAGDQPTRCVVGEDVRLEPHGLASGVDRAYQCRKILVTVTQQGDAVAR